MNEAYQGEVATSLPSLLCLQSGFTTKQDTRFINVATYNSDYTVYSDEDEFASFTGEYVLNLEESSQVAYMINFVWRGKLINISDGSFGIDDMFNDGDINHEVNITNYTSEYISPNLRKIKLIVNKIRGA